MIGIYPQDMMTPTNQTVQRIHTQAYNTHKANQMTQEGTHM